MPINHDAIECLSDVADEALFEVAIEASSQALFADASDVATHMANHVLHQPIGFPMVTCPAGRLGSGIRTTEGLM